MKNLIAFVLLAFLFLSCKASDEEEYNFIPLPEQSIEGYKIGSYNLRVKTGADVNERDWKSRRVYVKQLLSDYDMDIVGTQEGIMEQINDVVADANSPYAFVGVGRDDGALVGETCAILYKKSKFQVLDTETFWLSETPDKPSYGYGANYRRICTWAKFKEISTGKEFHVFNAHYDHEVALAREQASRIVMERIQNRAKDAVCFMTGDLNCTPDTKPIQNLWNSGLVKDGMAISEQPLKGPEGTIHGYNLQRIPNTRIDYVMVSNKVKVKSYLHIDHDRITNNIASDHLPVMAIVTF